MIVVGCVLGAQLFIILPGPFHTEYWPFLSYPMYSDAHHVGDAISFYELRLATADFPTRWEGVTFRQLGVRRHVLQRWMRDLVEATPQEESDARQSDAWRRLEESLRGRFGEHYARVGIWTRRVRMTPDGPEGLEAPMRQSFDRSLGGGDGGTDA